MTVQMRVDMRDTVSAGLRELMRRTGNVNEALDEIGGSLVTSTEKRIEDGTQPDGAKFEKHAPATIAKRGTGASILYDETGLWDSIDHKVTFGSKVAVGTNLIYGRIHQLGGEAGRVTARVTIPARPYLGISNEDRAEIEAIVTDRIRGLS